MMALKTYKGNYSSETSYSVGDVVTFTDGLAYHLQKAAAAGTSPTDIRYWQLCDQDTVEILKLVNDAITLSANKAAADLEAVNPDAKTLRIKSSSASSSKVFDITVVDNGTISATEYTPAT